MVHSSCINKITKLTVRIFRIIVTVLNYIPCIILFGLITIMENDEKYKKKKKRK